MVQYSQCSSNFKHGLCRVVRTSKSFTKPKINKFCTEFFIQQNIAKFQVPVNDRGHNCEVNNILS